MDKHFILHLTLIDSIGPTIIQRIQKRSDVNASDLYLFSQADWMNVFGFTPVTAEKLFEGLQNKKILEYELTLIAQHNIQWLTLDDPLYPALLREIYLPPYVLYCQGQLDDMAYNGELPYVNDSSCARQLNPSSVPSDGYPGEAKAEAGSKGCPRALEETLQQVQGERREIYKRSKFDGFYDTHRTLAIVGARKADEYGHHVVNALVPNLVAAHYTIVSGGALGIDTMAHQATIRCGGKTIAVLGSGLLMPYPLSNKKLFESIVDNGGALISAFPLTMEALPGHFPARNRIITGLSRGCLVVQAAEKSGALISAHYAMEQGREVFAVPGPFDSELSVGCNTLIQNGAKLVMNSADILTEFGDRVIMSDLRVTEHKVMQLNLESFQCARSELVEEYPRALKETVLPQFSFHSKPGTPSKETEDGDKTVQGERERTDESGKFHNSCDNKYAHYSEQQKLIIAACKQPTSFDAIVATTQLTVEAVQAELFNLQLDGIIEQDFTGMWVAVH